MERGREVLTWDKVGEVSRGQMMQDCQYLKTIQMGATEKFFGGRGAFYLLCKIFKQQE